MSLSEKHKRREKTSLHPRNKHRAAYEIEKLIQEHPELAKYEKPNIYGDISIDFMNRDAMVLLNQIFLKKFYGIENWDLPTEYLCPPIAGRADYIHSMADLLAEKNSGEIPYGGVVKCLDIGVGANCIYPIIGVCEYGWHFTGVDIDRMALDSAGRIVDGNPVLQGKVELRLQNDSGKIFKDIIRAGEKFDLTICNPPFYASLEEAESGALRKRSSLTQTKIDKAELTLSGRSNELWCEGGEERFLSEIINESREFAASVLWFTSLVSKKASLKGVYAALETAGAVGVKTIELSQGNKVSRVVAWRF